MSEQATGNKPSEGGQAIDLEKYVPKDEYTKLTAEVEGLKRTLEEEKMKLLDTGYLEFLESKRGKKLTQDDVDKAKAAGLPPEVLSLIEELKGRVVRTESAVANVSAILELREVEAKFADFTEYRDEVKKLLEADHTGALSFEKAYWQAKGMKTAAAKPKDTPKANGDTVTKGGEKPGQYIPPKESQKAFDSAYEAGQDAATQIKTKYSLSGDII